MVLSKPDKCNGCPLEKIGKGFSKPSGDPQSKLILVGEALGANEVLAGAPFVGAAGKMLDRMFGLSGIARPGVYIDNCIRCQPPGNELVGASYEEAALTHCRYLDESLEGKLVAVALGATATRRLLGLSKENFKLDNWQGLPVWNGKLWVVPTYHPSYIMQGKQKMIGVVLNAFLNAEEVVKQGTWKDEPAQLVVDPSPESFKFWVDQVTKSDHWLAVDIETADKIGENEEEVEAKDSQITRINFSVAVNEGVTVPFQGPYFESIRRLLQQSAGAVQCYWNAAYDIPRLRAAGFPPVGRCLDYMWAWHILQSDLPKGLGFVAPNFSRFGPWKHLAGPEPGKYAAIDAVQTIRCAIGITEWLQRNGQWDAFYRHVYQLNEKVLLPAKEVGLLIDEPNLLKLDKTLADLESKAENSLVSAAGSLVKLHPKGGWKKKPKFPLTVKYKRGNEKLEVIYNDPSALIVQTLDHGEYFVLENVPPRYFVREPFNADSPAQIMEYAKSKGQSLPDTTKLTLDKWAKKDPFYKALQDKREVSKIRSTYVRATLKRIAASGEPVIHPTFTFLPSTMRLSCVDPNIQNVVIDDGGPASGFRNCIIARPGHVFLEADYSAIEAVLTGWFMGDPDYIRLARLGVHSYLASHMLKEPANLSQTDEELKRFFEAIKSTFPREYDDAKHIVHGTNYGLTPFGMNKLYPNSFTQASAAKLQNLYFEICPKLPKWQENIRAFAHKNKYLGGESHPFKYKHWFWDVYGQDQNRVLAFLPSSTAAGVLKEAALRMGIGGDYAIGGRIRALIHDSFLVEVPEDDVMPYAHKIHLAMTDPMHDGDGYILPCPTNWNMGPWLHIGVSYKVGKNWGEMKKLDI